MEKKILEQLQSATAAVRGLVMSGSNLETVYRPLAEATRKLEARVAAMAKPSPAGKKKTDPEPPKE